MLKKTGTPTEEIVSKKEEDIISLENRRSRAEAEFLIICDDKKRLLDEIEKIQNDIKVAKNEVQQKNQEIIALNDEIANVKSKLREQKQDIANAIMAKDLAVKNLDKEISEKIARKNQIIQEITVLSDKYRDDKSQYEKEISILRDTKTMLEFEINSLNDKKKNIERVIKTDLANLSAVKKEIALLEEKIPLIHSSITSNENIIDDQKNIIANNKAILKQQDSEKLGKESEIAYLNNKIFEKQEEYKLIESKAFAILQKQEILDNKEAFIRSQYERAGIKWE